MEKRYLRFSDLKRLGIVGNWTTLRRWIQTEGFPAGIKLGLNTTVFDAAEVEAWLASRHRKGGCE
jgi:predicted DNA-binding transcriptional regulator AlpA